MLATPIYKTYVGVFKNSSLTIGLTWFYLTKKQKASAMFDETSGFWLNESKLQMSVIIIIALG